MFSHPELGSNLPNKSGRESGRDMMNVDLIKERVDKANSGMLRLETRDVEDPLLFLFLFFIYHLSFILLRFHLFVTPCCTFLLICYLHLSLDYLDYQ